LERAWPVLSVKDDVWVEFGDEGDEGSQAQARRGLMIVRVVRAQEMKHCLNGALDLPHAPLHIYR
jgi:hypothetical protein